MPVIASTAFGVAHVRHKEHPCPPVRGADSQSFKIPNPDAVPETLQILADVIGGNGKDARYVLSHNPTRANFSDQPRKLRPEESIVVPSFPVTSHGEGLAWEPSVNNVNCSDIRTLHLPHVPEQGHIRPVFPKYLSAERVDLAHRRHGPASPLERQIESAGQMPENKLNPLNLLSDGIEITPFSFPTPEKSESPIMGFSSLRQRPRS